MGSREICRHGRQLVRECDECDAEGQIWREEVAEKVLGHIDTMYPKMWEGVPKTARLSIRNTILNALNH